MKFPVAPQLMIAVMLMIFGPMISFTGMHMVLLLGSATSTQARTWEEGIKISS